MATTGPTLSSPLPVMRTPVTQVMMSQVNISPTCHEPYYAPASQVDRGHGGRLEAGLVLPVHQVKRGEEQRSYK